MKNQANIYKVYCGTNGKWYTFTDEKKAELLMNKLRLNNFYCEMRVIKQKIRRKYSQIPPYGRHQPGSAGKKSGTLPRVSRQT